MNQYQRQLEEEEEKRAREEEEKERLENGEEPNDGLDPYGNPYGNPYGDQYDNPYGNPYGGGDVSAYMYNGGGYDNSQLM